MEHTTIAVDLAKSVFQIAVSHQPGRVDVEQRLSRDRLVDGTVRPPVGEAETNPRVHALVAAVGRETGHPVVLNTSFNVRGEPCVLVLEQDRTNQPIHVLWGIPAGRESPAVVMEAVIRNSLYHDGAAAWRRNLEAIAPLVTAARSWHLEIGSDAAELVQEVRRLTAGHAQDLSPDLTVPGAEGTGR